MFLVDFGHQEKTKMFENLFAFFDAHPPKADEQKGIDEEIDLDNEDAQEDKLDYVPNVEMTPKEVTVEPQEEQNEE